MGKYTVKRILLLIPTIFLVCLIVFALMRCVPGDAVDAIVTRMTQSGQVVDADAVRVKLGMDKPAYVQFFVWLSEVCRGDLGDSFFQFRSVSDILSTQIPVSLELGIISLVLSNLISIPIGLFCAAKQDSISDYTIRIIAVILMSIPMFWLANLVLFYPAQWWGYAPPTVYVSFFDDPIQNMKMFLVPGILGALAQAGMQLRLVRTQVLDTLRQDYVRTAYAKGVKQRTVLFRHAFRNAMIPVITIIGGSIGAMVGGNMILENLFNIPGIGSQMVTALGQRDYPVVQGCVLVMSVFVMVINLLVDLCYKWIDPRVKLIKGGRKMQLMKDLFKKKTIGGICMVVLIAFLLIAIFADVIAPTPLGKTGLPKDVRAMLIAPFTNLAHPLGTDKMGQDLLSYMIYGARTSVILCVCCTILSTLVSLVIGVLSAVIGGWFDLIVQRVVDAFGCIPQMLLLLLMMSLMGNGIPQMIVALSVPSGIGGSRMVRSSALAVKDSGYCDNSDLLGGGVLWKSIKHVVPNIMPLIIISAAGSLGGVVMMEASMNFLGYGVAPGTPSWAPLITGQGRDMLFTAPWLCIIPGIAIALLTFCSSMFGDAIRDLLDPRLKGGVGSYNSKKLKKVLAKLEYEDEFEEDMSEIA